MKEPTITIDNKPNFNPFAGPEIDRVIYTTQPQAEIWIACKLGDDDANRAYNESVSLILKGDLGKSAFDDAVQTLVDRHEALRAVFSTDGRFMTIFKQLSIAIDDQDFSEFSDAEKDKSIKNYLSAEANYVFDLVKGPLLKVGLLKLSETEHQLVLTGHHIICDGWSIGIMLQELGGLYSANVLKTTPTLPKPESFSAYADEQQAYLASPEHTKNENFWLDQFKGTVPQLTLPTDFPRPQYRTFKSERLDLPMPMELVDALKKTGLKAGSSLVTTLLSTFEIFLYTQTGQEDIVLGLPSADQAASGKIQMVGHCVNLLPLRSKIDTTLSFKDYLKQRKPQLFDAYEHQKFSFGELLQKLSIARDPSRVPLVPVVFNIDMGMDDGVSFTGLEYQLKSNPRAYETFEIFLNASGSADALVLEWSYNSNIFKPESIKEMMVSFEKVVKSVVANPDIKIGDIIKVEASEYAELNNTSASYPKEPLHELLLKQAQVNPTKTALKFGDAEISYGELEKQVHQLAHYLKAQGVANGDFVAVSLPRSIELIVTLIAIMECGAAYLPLDPSYPSKRLEFMLEDSEAKFMMTAKAFSSALESSAKLLLLENIFSNLTKYPITPLPEKVDIENVIYILYTSGSTGKPKGVPITHKNLVNLLYSVLEKPGIKASDTLISITTISFDIAMVELFAPLLIGAKLIITNEETSKDTRLLLDVMKKEKITMMQATPATWQMLLYSGWDEPLPIRAISTGEALPLALAKSILKQVTELWNMYGPTETTIWSAMKKISKEDNLIAIGHPMANTQLYIVDEHNRLVSPGKTGELCIAGDGVAPGYWKRDDLTAEKFIKNPIETDLSPTLYRTGDLARLLPTGDVHCLGRMDHQVKIRGQRIELEEIEQALDALDGIQSAVVLLNDDQLIANVITSDLDKLNTNQVNAWKDILKDQLPAHMIPHQFILVKSFPTTLSGKIDRKALLQNLPTKDEHLEFIGPVTESEKIISAIWEECLKIDKVDSRSDFFELGGHSVIGVQVMAKLEKETGNRLPLVALLKHPTVKKLAAYMDSEFIVWDSLVPLKPEGTKPALYVVHGANHNVLMFNALAHHLDKDQPVFGLQSRGLSGVDEPHDSIDQMAADYISEILASNPNGPYALGGFSYGGIVAFEMARQLRAQGKEVTIVAQFDTYVYPSYYHTNPIKKKLLSNLFQMGKVVYLSFNMFASKKHFIRRKELLKIQISGLFLRLKHGKEKQYEMQFNVPYKMEQNHQKATNAYTITPQDFVIDLFRAMEEINFVHDHDLLGWKKMGLRGIRKHMVPGNHVDMFEEPNVEALAKRLQYVLDNKNLKSV
ncbi:non-ribosomal peptide synthetase [Gelidibacter pelagius]|uniref:Amino acid adenylation domain-containing protein n=1 Tax=Gelidibacter pelagius TaxID=2819985 RepID=A0ABS3SSG2_9FLAO|nr:non-ribosomal peptide synthetase [Gelidibacter pelagius]MBO3098653.1 amino acid adenylation domain-containing protein [Gelidibacter pelagius]